MIKIVKYGQYIKIYSNDFNLLIYKFKEFLRKFITMKLDIRYNRYTKRKESKLVLDKLLYIIDEDKDGSFIRLPIMTLNRVINFITLNKVDDYVIQEVNPISCKKIKIETNKKFTLRDYQNYFINEIIKQKYNSVLVELDTGLGKTLIAMFAIAKLGCRFSIVVLPRYIDKWRDDIKKYTNLKDDDILVIDSMKTLIKVLVNGKKNIRAYKAFILSLTTIKKFITYYIEKKYDKIGGFKPDDIFRILRTTVVLNDETHQHFHTLYLLSLFSNVKILIGLTATFESDNRFIERAYSYIFPPHHRVKDNNLITKYLYVISVSFKFKSKRNLIYKSNYGYNQPIYEKSIMLNRTRLNNYLEMIYDLIKRIYIYGFKNGYYNHSDKLLIFIGTIELAKHLLSYLMKKDELKEFKINKYTQEEDYQTLFDNDIIISTVQSAGTAVDIPNLVAVINTVNQDSTTSNRQIKGRLRNKEGKILTYCYVWSMDIPQHRRYNLKRLELLEPYAKEIKNITYFKEI